MNTLEKFEKEQLENLKAGKEVHCICFDGEKLFRYKENGPRSAERTAKSEPRGAVNSSADGKSQLAEEAQVEHNW